MQAVLIFRGDTAATEAFCKILGQRDCTLLFPRESSESIRVKGTPAAIAGAIAEMLSTNSRIEAELKSADVTTTVTQRDTLAQLEQIILSAGEVRLTFKVKN